MNERTYSEPEKWMRGKGRVTIQFGCCYNYAMDREGNPPGILRNVTADPIPSLFKVIIKRLVRWHVLPPSCIPDSCIVNIYDPGDCIPPHIDNHDFVRPFCTVSFVSECNIVFGSNLKIVGPGDFMGSTAIPLPVGSVLVLNGNGADVAKHCVPAVAQKRISITFRRMGEAKWPFGFQPEPDLQGIQPLEYEASSPQRSPYLITNAEPATPESHQYAYSRGRPEPKPEHSTQDQRALPRDVTGRGRRRKPSRVVVDGRSVTDGSKAEGSAGWPHEASPVPDIPGILPLPADASEIARTSSRATRAAGRTVSMEQKRIVVRSYLEGGEESSSSLTWSEPPGNPRFQASRTIDRRRSRVGLGQ